MIVTRSTILRNFIPIRFETTELFEERRRKKNKKNKKNKKSIDTGFVPVPKI